MSLVFRNIDPPPLRPASVSYPRNKDGGTHSPGGEGDGGGSIFWKTREIGLPSYSNNLSKVHSHGVLRDHCSTGYCSRCCCSRGYRGAVVAPMAAAPVDPAPLRLLPWLLLP
jgi:hypothetical protein